MSDDNTAFIGLDLGGTFLKFALGKADGTVLANGKLPSRAQESQQEIFKVMFAAVEQMLDKAHALNLHVVGIGVGSPGAIDFDHGRVLGNTPNLPNWTNADIRGQLQGKFNIPVWADNDANLMTLAECRYGAAKGARFVVALTLGTGIGGGIVIENQLFRGARFSGAELGHMSINFAGPVCGCGGIGCIEAYASAPAMVKNYREKLIKKQLPVPNPMNTELIFTQARQGDPLANQVIDEICFYLGAALGNIINIFNPEVIVIGGGVADAGEAFIQRIWKAVQGRAMEPALQHARIERASLGNDAGMVGAIALAADGIHANR